MTWAADGVTGDGAGVLLPLSSTLTNVPEAGLAMWAALLDSGVDPIVTGLAIGLSAPAYSPAREQLEQATELVRLCGEVE